MFVRRVRVPPLVPRTPPIIRTVFQVPYSPVEEAQTPVELDPSYLRLWEDVDSSLKRHEAKESVILNDAEILDVEPRTEASDLMTVEVLNGDEVDSAGLSERVMNMRWKRKSPEARIGSDRVGQYTLPFELQRSMEKLISRTASLLCESPSAKVLSYF